MEAERWQLELSAIDRLKTRMTDPNLDVIDLLKNWIHFSFVIFSINNPNEVSATLTNVMSLLGVPNDVIIDQNLRSDTEQKEKFFAYYAIVTLCFEDNGLKQGTFTKIFENDHRTAIMEQLAKYNPPMGEEYAIYCSGLTQDKIDNVKQTAQQWLSCNCVATWSGFPHRDTEKKPSGTANGRCSF